MAILENELVADDLMASERPSLFLDKTEIQRIVAEQNAKSGFVPDPTATAERAQALVGADLRARGLKPEDNVFSRGIITARDGE